VTSVTGDKFISFAAQGCGFADDQGECTSTACRAFAFLLQNGEVSHDWGSAHPCDTCDSVTLLAVLRIKDALPQPKTENAKALDTLARCLLTILLYGML